MESRLLELRVFSGNKNSEIALAKINREGGGVGGGSPEGGLSV